MKTALITGVAGQDGSYMAELLVAKGYRVIGTVRDRQVGLSKLPRELDKQVQLVDWNMQDTQHMTEVLREHQPAEIYNFAAYSSGEGMYDDPVAIGELNGLTVARLLEAVRATGPNIRLCQASSREVFGEALESPQSESTRVCPRSPYGAAKMYADAMVRIHRQKYGTFACSAILFNHESPRRGLGFVTRKISHAAAQIRLGISSELHIGNLEAQRDWGFAGDYVRAMWLMLQQERASDYVIATGKTHSVRQLCELAFGHVGLDYRDHVREDTSAYRPVEPALLVGSFAKARAELGWAPEVPFDVLVRMMVDTDMQVLSELNPNKN